MDHIQITTGVDIEGKILAAAVTVEICSLSPQRSIHDHGGKFRFHFLNLKVLRLRREWISTKILAAALTVEISSLSPWWSIHDHREKFKCSLDLKSLLTICKFE